VRERPTVLKRYPDGAAGEFFYQKRVPSPLPEWLETVTVTFPSGRSARELCPVDVAHLVWAVNLGCLDLNPWAVRRTDVDHPDELRVDLDPQPGVEFSTVRRVAAEVKSVLEGIGLVGWPKTSGSRGVHVYVRIEPRWDFLEVRRAALALAGKWSGGSRISRPASGGRRSAERGSSSTTTRTRVTGPSPRPTRCEPTPRRRSAAR
jgi:DNA primase